MTCRERLVAASRGGEVDRKPVIRWPYWKEDSDLRHFNHDTMPDHIEESSGEVALVEITNPFGLALQKGIDLNKRLKEDPKAGNRMLGEMIDEAKRDIDLAFEVGADGILYRVYGARGLHCTPMQYGGYYLEQDRELLESVKDSLFNVVFVVGEEDVYLDFVSDLPGHAFGWDFKESKIPVSEVRKMREGALLSEDPESDIRLEPGTAFLSRMLESSLRTEDSYAV
jgi:hypothetical protein